MIVPGLAVNPMFGTCRDQGESHRKGTEDLAVGRRETLPVAPQGGVPFTTVTTPQNITLMLDTVAGPAFRTPPCTVPTRPSWYGRPADPTDWEAVGRQVVLLARVSTCRAVPGHAVDRPNVGRWR